ncbi:hypothetical protein PAHAL_9G301100 [Panicum hallii]|uniref:Uncharacterized protein n=1 Tax=Panicum hallii TaxID=206008 RepID=A0A2T8I2Z8_9POAL|nr:uncharacterized protein LOC112876174 isoform X2 [Panicum hallii]PVH32047.1 hypothetical protein PAHAL_9G301100 [Panicum hallii]PVH32048.1 hypothetical protein PAHAL_9G301100 [Panicum hallii]PVH32049.1 hypothetical protein PAHAL_9G301100 [Panicum hallii]PVH32050.1 hypothetical protein PAHAL_9G301100 [Panicum hallii]
MGAKRIVTLPPCAALVALAAPSVRHLLLLPRSAPGTRPCPSPVPRGQAFPSWAAACHGGGARSWQEMEEPPLRFFRDIFPENHADLSWVPDRATPTRTITSVSTPSPMTRSMSRRLLQQTRSTPTRAITSMQTPSPMTRSRKKVAGI